MKKLIILALFGFLLNQTSQAQIKLNAVVGGGTSSIKQFLDTPRDLKLKPGYLINAGITATTKFRKDGMLSFETGAILSTSGYESYFANWEATNQNNGKTVWRPEAYKARTYFLKVPLTFDFNVYERFGLLFGGHLNLRLYDQHLENALIPIRGSFDEDSKYEKIIPGLHLGFYGNITDRIRLDAKVFSDITPRLYNNVSYNKPQYREIGFSLNLNYLLNP